MTAKCLDPALPVKWLNVRGWAVILALLICVPAKECLAPNLESKEVTFDFLLSLKRSIFTRQVVSSTDPRTSLKSSITISANVLDMLNSSATKVAETTTTIITTTSTTTPHNTMNSSMTALQVTNATSNFYTTAAARASVRKISQNDNTTTWKQLHQEKHTTTISNAVSNADLHSVSHLPAKTFNTLPEPTSNSRLPYLPRDMLLYWLSTLFENTIGYVSIAELATEVRENRADFSYRVHYDVARLSKRHALGEQGKLSQQFWQIRRDIVDSNVIFRENWKIHDSLVLIEMEHNLQTASRRLKTLCSILGPVCSNVSFACDLLDTGAVTCTHKCELFARRNHCLGSGLFAKGRCVLDINNLPYCSCGQTLLLSNFFDGKRCVNMSVIVSLAAAIVCSLVAIFIIVVTCQAVKIKKKRNAMLNLRASDRLHSSFDPPPLCFEGSLPRNGQTPKKLYSSSKIRELYGDQVSNDPRCHSLMDEDGTTSITQTDDRRLSSTLPILEYVKTIDPAESDAFKNFVPNLINIDTKISYAIKRPNVTLRPTDNYFNDRNYGGYAEHQL